MSSGPDSGLLCGDLATVAVPVLRRRADSSLKRFSYLDDRLFDWNMLPDTKNTPPGRMKSLVDRAITIDVPL
jgi:hypothetical protein